MVDARTDPGHQGFLHVFLACIPLEEVAALSAALHIERRRRRI
jgi:hypothetical protein